MDVVLPIVLLLGVVLTAVGIYFSNVAIYPRRKSVQQTYDMEVEPGKIVPAEFEALPREEVHIRSPYGYDLYGLYFPLPGARKTVIICHGITYTLYGSVKYMGMFRRRGYNVLLYDHRYHGRSGGPNCSFGYYEKHDLKAVVDWVLARVGADSLVGTHGESMGAAIALQHAALDPRLAFVVADCPFASAEEQFAYRLRVEYHLPAFPLIPLASLITKLRAGWWFHEVSPLRVIEQVQTPVLFAHGQDDDYIPPQASERMYDRKPGLKRLYLAPHARHAEAYWNNQEEYDRQVGEFLAVVAQGFQAQASMTPD